MISRRLLHRRVAALAAWLRVARGCTTAAGRRLATNSARAALWRLRADLAPGVRFAANVPYRIYDHKETPRAVSIEGAQLLARAAEAALAEGSR